MNQGSDYIFIPVELRSVRMPVNMDPGQGEIEVLDMAVRRIQASISNAGNKIISDVSTLGHACNLKQFSFSHMFLHNIQVPPNHAHGW